MLLARVYDTATTLCAKAFVTFINVTVPALNVIAVDGFGTCICH
jgi:hypothetical protein